MINSTPEAPASSAPLDGAALRHLIERNVDRDVQEKLRTPLRFHHRFIDECEHELHRLGVAVEGILERETRRNLDRLHTTLRAIVRSCVVDAQDVDEELLLPLILKRLVDATDEYAHAISLPATRSTHRDALVTFQRELTDAHLPWARQLLDRMTLNDSLPAAERLSLSTVFFAGKK
jgi:hypothetical protein